MTLEHYLAIWKLTLGGLIWLGFIIWFCMVCKPFKIKRSVGAWLAFTMLMILSVTQTLVFIVIPSIITLKGVQHE